jgi:hypothetical protein
MSLLSTTVKTTVTANQADAFEQIVPIDLTYVFKGYGLLHSKRKRCSLSYGIGFERGE